MTAILFYVLGILTMASIEKHWELFKTTGMIVGGMAGIAQALMRTVFNRANK